MPPDYREISSGSQVTDDTKTMKVPPVQLDEPSTGLVFRSCRCTFGLVCCLQVAKIPERGRLARAPVYFITSDLKRESSSSLILCAASLIELF
jgi:hypothetical protein